MCFVEKFERRSGRWRFGAQQREMAVGRVAGFAALGKRKTGEAVEVVPLQRAEQGVIRMPGLDQHLARLVRASGAAADLHDDLEQALAGAEVRPIQSLIGVEYPDQRDVGKIMAFREHLGAYQDVGLAGVHATQLLLERALAAGAVAVHALDARLREKFPQRAFHALRALAERMQVSALT